MQGHTTQSDGIILVLDGYLDVEEPRFCDNEPGTAPLFHATDGRLTVESMVFVEDGPIVDCAAGDLTGNPGALEVCNGRDDDCYGLVDEELLEFLSIDEDEDGHGSTQWALACFEDGTWFMLSHATATRFTSSDGDGDDGNESIREDAVEDGRNAVDDDCDELLDELDPDCMDTPHRHRRRHRRRRRHRHRCGHRPCGREG